ncbi:NAD(P)/FAD-dependent oxidoreductase [Inhella sp.]|uniref:NAD(P)/FAD-dependent oxidoreductase n=1 Tax=Inhella sp. TaxID=1921806 RepID=UPI0035B2DA95
MGAAVLVIGAGPAGSACARLLALGGRSVQLVDAQPIGRDKVCGDGLIPDAHHALERLGLLEAVMAEAERVAHVGCIGPGGGRIDVPGRLAVLPRRRLDEILVRGALAAGATFLQARFEAPLEEDGRVVGACLRRGEETLEVRASTVLLATGAAAKPLQAAGMCTRQAPSGIALRGYVHAPSMVGRIRALEVAWTKAVRPGYGWIFPAPDGHFNIGVGVSDSHSDGRMKDVNLRQLFDDFVAAYPPAQQLMREGQLVGELKGAPLRCTLAGSHFTRPGLMVIGEAAGSTYDFTGEGIGKAMQTGMLAADAILQQPDDDAAARAQYEAALAALQPRFALYAKANRVNAFPWLADLLIWRAKKSERLLRRMAGVLEETSNPGNLLTLKGFTRLFTE